MNILVTGANGQLGNEMRIVSRSAYHKFYFTDVAGCNEPEKGAIGNDKENTLDIVHFLDITDIVAVRSFVAEHKINCIVNCAAYTNVAAAEDNEALAELLNAGAVENLAVVMHETEGFLVHISTDYVFGGNHNNTPCGEDEPENPTGVYGVTKLHGEQAIKRVGGNYVILRTAWLYSEFGKNFLKTMLSLTASKPELNVVFDQAGTPTYALDLAHAIMAVIEDYAAEGETIKMDKENNLLGRYSKTGVYHYSNEGVCSWYDFTQMIASLSGNTACRIKPCHSSEFPSNVVRPSYSVLDKTKIKESFGLQIPYWVESLKVCIQNLIN